VEEAAQNAVGFGGWAAGRQAVEYGACYPGERAARRTAAAEAAGPIAAEGEHPIDSVGPIAGSGVAVAEDTGCQSTGLRLAVGSLGVVADSLEGAVDNLEGVVDSSVEAAGPDSLGSDGLADDGHLKAAQ
jgi:hypothetical protein